MFLPIEVARSVDRERRRQAERRIPLLVAIREQREQAASIAARRQDSARGRTGPLSPSRTGSGS